MNKKIEVFGIGDFGIEIVNNLSKEAIVGVNYLSVNTDFAFLDYKNKNHLRIGYKITRGLGTGGLAEFGMRAAKESKELIIESLKGASCVIIISGFGGGTGSGTTPVLAEYAEDLNIPCYILATLPFEYENKYRQRNIDFAVNKINELDTSLIKLKTFPLNEQNISMHVKLTDIPKECARIFQKYILNIELLKSI